MYELQSQRPSRVNRRGATVGRNLEAVADFALPDLLGAGELGLIARDLARRVGAESTLLAVRDETGDSVQVLAAWGDVSGYDERPPSSADGFLGRVLYGEEAILEPFDPDQDDSLGVSASGARVTYAAGAA